MKSRLLIFFLFLCVFAKAQQLRIAVAANAQFVVAKLKDAFTKESGTDADITVSSSGKLTAQIEQGAPFDVFMSADMKYPQELYSKGFAMDKPAVYAYGTLVMWSLHKRNFSNGLKVVLNNDVRKIAVANPKLAPYGEATLAALTKQNILQNIQPKIVYGESVSAVNQYLLSGAVDLAFTAKSVVLDSAFANMGVWNEVDENLYQPIAQGVVVIKYSPHLKAAQQWYQFLFTPTAKAIFTKYGYR